MFHLRDNLFEMMSSGSRKHITDCTPLQFTIRASSGNCWWSDVEDHLWWRNSSIQLADEKKFHYPMDTSQMKLYLIVHRSSCHKWSSSLYKRTHCKVVSFGSLAAHLIKVKGRMSISEVHIHCLVLETNVPLVHQPIAFLYSVKKKVYYHINMPV